MELVLSSLPHTWLIDIDGTIAVHNGYFLDGTDTLLNDSAEFIRTIPQKDRIILLTSRKEEFREKTEQFLAKNGIRYDEILFGLPTGERILINDDKPSDICMSYAVRLKRNCGIQVELVIDNEL